MWVIFSESQLIGSVAFVSNPIWIFWTDSEFWHISCSFVVLNSYISVYQMVICFRHFFVFYTYLCKCVFFIYPIQITMCTEKIMSRRWRQIWYLRGIVFNQEREGLSNRPPRIDTCKILFKGSTHQIHFFILNNIKN